MAICKGIFALVVLSHTALADHPCTAEVASACAERPSSDIATCLKDPEEHDSPTEISSECGDFIALNKACAADIEEHCEAGQFSDDTLLCLTKWTQKENLSPKCQSVMEWAVPSADAEVVTDELGMSDEDYQEKKAWQAKRKAEREQAMGTMKDREKQKEIDRKKEEDRVALEKFKEEDPDGYEQMLEQQAEEKRQKAEFKRRERAQAAAAERARKKAKGEDEEEQETNARTGGRKMNQPKSKGSWLYSLGSIAFIAALGAGGFYLVKGSKGGGGKKSGGGKKRR